MHRRPSLEREAERALRAFRESSGDRAEDGDRAPASETSRGCGGILVACVVLIVGFVAVAGGPQLLMLVVAFGGPVILGPLLLMLFVGLLLVGGPRSSESPKTSKLSVRRPGSFGGRHR